MAIGRTNAGGGGFNKSVIIVTAPTGSTVTCTKGTTVKTATEKNGEWWFKNLDIGTWTLNATLSGQTETQTVNITQFGVYRVAMVYRLTPEFTYTGNYKVVQDNDSEISDFANWKGNWKIRFLTSGTFTVTNMYGWTDNHIDVFLVGGGANGSTVRGGKGGGGGYTKTVKGVNISIATPYTIAIGASSGTSTAFGASANGASGGDGGSGGGGGGRSSESPGNGGSNGGNGTAGSVSNGGTGQGTTTREFGESTGNLYSGGGGGSGFRGGSAGDSTAGNGAGYGDVAKNGVANTGGGGGAAYNGTAGSGGSGIVIIRNTREAV